MSNLFFPRENKNCCVVRLPIPLGCMKQKTSDHIVSKWKQAKMGHWMLYMLFWKQKLIEAYMHVMTSLYDVYVVLIMVKSS